MTIDWRGATDAVLAFCGIPAEGLLPDDHPTGAPAHGEQMIVWADTGECLGSLVAPIIQTRAIPESGAAPSPRIAEGAHPLLQTRTLALGRFARTPADWTALLVGSVGEERVPIAWRTPNGIRLSPFLRDAIAIELTFAPLIDGYYSRGNSSDPCPIADRIHREHHACRPEGTPPSRGSEPAMVTLRLDYDRAIALSDVRSLLDLLDALKVRASCGFLLRREDDAVAARMLEENGHEILLHTEAGDRQSFLAECDRFEARFGVRPLGYTAHGGRGSAGYLGQRQWEWAIEAGMIYGEVLGRNIHRMHPLVLVDDSGRARTARLHAPGVHFSLDAGMKPEAHHLELLLERCPGHLLPGSHVVLMNHPDLHREELRSLLECVMSHEPESTTFAELASRKSTDASPRSG